MLAIDRHRWLLDELNERGSLRTSEIAERAGVAEETIRRDFEQLTALMTQADDDQSARKAWDEQKRLLQAQVEALEKRYLRNRKPPPADDDPVIKALADMRKSLAAEERPHRKI